MKKSTLLLGFVKQMRDPNIKKAIGVTDCQLTVLCNSNNTVFGFSFGNI